MIIGNTNNQIAVQNTKIPELTKTEISKNVSDSISVSSEKDVPFYTNNPSLKTASVKETATTNGTENTINSKLAEQITSEIASSLLPATGAVALKILYTNDIHGAILPEKRDEQPEITFGGISSLATLMSEKTEEGKTIKIDGGDWAQGTYASGKDKGQTMMKLLSAIGYDAAVIGNHDFDWGREALNKMLDNTGFPVLGANITNSKNGKTMDGLKPYIIKDINGIKVGIIGVTSPKTKGETSAINTEGLDFGDPVASIKKYLPEMEKQNTEMILVASHCGDNIDEKIAREIPEIDVIVGGHSHNSLNPPRQVGKTLIVQSGSNNFKLGELNLNYDKAQDKIVSFENNIIPINSQTSGPNPEIEKILSPIIGEIMEKMNEYVGETEIDLTRRGSNAETIMGNIITDSMRKAAGTDVAFINQGGIRAGIKPGIINYDAVYKVMPSENAIVTMDLTGKQLKGVMEESARRNRGTIEVSGMKMDIEPRNANNQRVTNITVNGEPLDLNKIYRVAAADFLATGGNGYEELARGQNYKDEDILIRDALHKYMKDTGKFTEANAKVEGRQNYLSPKPLVNAVSRYFDLTSDSVSDNP